MMPEPFSIVIPSHRRVDLLALCLESLRKFAPESTQVIVVDDGSKDASVTATARAFSNVEVLRFDSPQGFCRAANAGIAKAKHRIVEMLNDDAEVTANWHEAPLAHFDDASVAAVAPLVLKNQPGPVRIDSAGDEYDCGGFAKKRLHNAHLGAMPTALRGHASEAMSLMPTLSRGHGTPDRICTSVSACAAFYRRATLLDAGGFPEDFGAYFDDVDLSCRLRARGYSLRFEPRSTVLHRVSSTYGQRSRRVIELQSRNEERLYWRNSASLATLPRHLAVLAAKSLRRVEEGTLGPWLAGRLYVLRDRLTA